MITPASVYDIVDDLFLAFRGFERNEELARVSADGTLARFGWGNWEPQPEPILFKGTVELAPADYTVNLEDGTVGFEVPLAPTDEIRCIYTMRLFAKSIYASFAPLAFSAVNARKPQTNWNFDSAPDLAIAPIVGSIYLATARMCLLKIGMFKWRRLFENPEDISAQLRANIAEMSITLEASLAGLKRRGIVAPAAVSMFTPGRTMSFPVDNINFQAYVVTR